MHYNIGDSAGTGTLYILNNITLICIFMWYLEWLSYDLCMVYEWWYIVFEWLSYDLEILIQICS